MLVRAMMYMNALLVGAAFLWGAVHAELYPDGACPLFALMPFTSLYVVMLCRIDSSLETKAKTVLVSLY